MIFASIAYKQILGFSVVILLGMITYLFLIASVITGVLMLKGKAKIQNHRWVTWPALILATIHALLVILANLGV